MASEEALTLFVDDVSDLLEAIYARLADIGCRAIAVASSVEEALGILDTRPVKHVVSDWRMPDDGLEFLLRIRSSHPATKLTLLTGFQEALTAEQRTNLAKADVSVREKADVNTLWLADLVGFEVPDGLTVVEEETAMPEPNRVPIADIVAQQRLRIEGLEAELAHRRRVINLFATDLIQELSSYPNLETKNIIGDYQRVSVADVLREIEQQTPEGIRLLELDRNVRKRLAR